jgi:hypothetical protein
VLPYSLFPGNSHHQTICRTPTEQTSFQLVAVRNSRYCRNAARLQKPTPLSYGFVFPTLFLVLNSSQFSGTNASIVLRSGAENELFFTNVTTNLRGSKVLEQKSSLGPRRYRSKRRTVTHYRPAQSEQARRQGPKTYTVIRKTILTRSYRQYTS